MSTTTTVNLPSKLYSRGRSVAFHYADEFWFTPMTYTEMPQVAAIKISNDERIGITGRGGAPSNPHFFLASRPATDQREQDQGRRC